MFLGISTEVDAPVVAVDSPVALKLDATGEIEQQQPPLVFLHMSVCLSLSLSPALSLISHRLELLQCVLRF